MKLSLLLSNCLLLIQLANVKSTVVTDYDFEDGDLPHTLIADNSVITRDAFICKSKSHSMLWSMKSGSTPKLTLNIKTGLVTPTNLRHFAVKFWMYRTVAASPNTKLNMVFRDSTTATALAPVTVHLDFKGWRAVWVTLKGFPGYPFHLPVTKITEIELLFMSPLVDDQKIYFDLFNVLTDQFWHRETRDRIVRNEGPFTKDIYDVKYNFQQSLMWSQYPVPPPNVEDSRSVEEKVNDIVEIEDRLESWFANKSKGLHDDGVKGRPRTDFEEARSKRWSTMQRSFYFANNAFEKNLKFLSDGSNMKTKITGPPLFGYRSKYGIHNRVGEYMKFSTVFQYIFFPLAMEYNLKGREREVKDTARMECSNLVWRRSHGLERIAGPNKAMMNFLDTELPASGDINCANLTRIEQAIKKLNDERWLRIDMLLDYLEDQGWSDGSGLGSLDQEMNRSGTGFMLGLFLIRKKLMEKRSRYNKWVETAKWYNRFNAIYQGPLDYAYDGENADTCRNILRYNLIIVLMQAAESKEAKVNRIRDMRYYKTWVEHSLKINKALAGLIKPDYTSFHHAAFYGSAYVSEALHNIAIVQCHLEGTVFALNDQAKHNLRKALELFRFSAVKYSTPNGICGRFPNYENKILLHALPAFAYISYIPKTNSSSSKSRDAEMFLRLYDFSDLSVMRYLEHGYLGGGIFFFKSIGSLDIMQNTKEKALVKQEVSPSGHRSLNFAALNIHRRLDWSVAAKGFGNYVWDFEAGPSENQYGLFQSHGSLQISNSEATLLTSDVKSGWLWTHVPGATTFDLSLDKFKSLDNGRTYNHIPVAGGVSLRGRSSDSTQNGVFGMELGKLPYRRPTPEVKDLQLGFKKSYFFMDHLIVCLGSDITLQRVSEKPLQQHAQTTLLQDRNVSMLVDQRISVGGMDYGVAGADVNLVPQIQAGKHLDLKDSHGNIYRVTNLDDSQELHVNIQKQFSMSPDGRERTSGRYATAFLQHTVVSGSKYLYAILVNGGDVSLLDKYLVLQKDDAAHVVEFKDLPRYGAITTGYTVFKGESVFHGGPIRKASRPCTIMTEEIKEAGLDSLHIALSNPGFKMVDNYPKNISNPTCRKRDIQKINPPRTLSDTGVYLLYCTESDKSTITVALSYPVTSQQPIDVWVDDVRVADTEKGDYISVDGTRMHVTFKNLSNGFSVEASFRGLAECTRSRC